MAASLNEIYKMLGELTGTVKAIEKKVDDLGEDMTASEASSAVSRANVHRRLDDVIDRTSHLEGQVASITQKFAKVEQVTDDVKTITQQAQGAGTLGRWLIRIGVGVLTAGGWLVGVYTYLTGRPPP